MKDRQGFKVVVNNYIQASKIVMDVGSAGYGQLRNAQSEIKSSIKSEICYWMDQNDLSDCHNRLELDLIVAYSTWYDNRGGPRAPRIHIGYTSLFSSKGSLGRAKWLNKITIGDDVVSHIARTDERFLGMDLVESFRDFVFSLRAEVQDAANGVWKEHNEQSSN